MDVSQRTYSDALTKPPASPVQAPFWKPWSLLAGFEAF
jgi:hypothetical protein